MRETTGEGTPGAGQGTEQQSVYIQGGLLCTSHGVTRASQQEAARGLHRLQKPPEEDSNMLGGGDMGVKDGGPLGLIHVGWGEEKKVEVNPCTSARKMTGLHGQQRPV